jgi:hypothetical protein
MALLEQQQIALVEEFQRRTQARAREQRAELEDERQRDQERREARREEQQREFSEALEAIDRANQAQIAAFHERLDHYDRAVIESLMDNQEALDVVNRELDRMRREAFTLPDGRKVFKSIDGERVFDENGALLNRETIDPDAIGGRQSSWEEYKAQRDAKTCLEQERSHLLAFQERLDHARATAGKDDVGAKALDDLGAELDRAMPETVRRKLAEHGRDLGPASETSLIDQTRPDASTDRPTKSANPSFGK